MNYIQNYSIAIIGSGPSGISVAIELSKLFKNANLENYEIHIFEKSDSLCKTILRTGNGRCNFSNKRIDSQKYHNAQFVSKFLDFGYFNTSNFLDDLGLVSIEKENGFLFPLSNSAKTVRHVLLHAIQNNPNIYVHLNFEINDMQELSNFDYVIFSTGSALKANLLPKDVDFNNFIGLLCPIECNEKDIKKLGHLRAKCNLKLLRDNIIIFQEKGEVQFREYGISGIVCFNASRYIKNGDIIELDFLDVYDSIDFPNKIENKIKNGIFPSNDLTNSNDIRDMLHNSLIGITDNSLIDVITNRILNKFSYSNSNTLETENIANTLINEIRHFKLTFSKLHDDNKTIQIYRGGVDVNSINPVNMQIITSDQNRTYFACGDAIDVDGPCGGYNLNWAFSTGIRCAIGIFDDICKHEITNKNTNDLDFLDEKEALYLLKQGKAIIVQTDTVMGTSASVDYCDTNKLVNGIKQAPHSKPVALLASNVEQVKKFVDNIPDYALSFIKEEWPGGLTLIFNANNQCDKSITSNKNTIAFRIPAYKPLLDLIDKLGSPLATSSANLFSKASAFSVIALDQKIINNTNGIFLGDECGLNASYGIASTIIDCTNDEPIFIR